MRTFIPPSVSTFFPPRVNRHQRGFQLTCPPRRIHLCLFFVCGFAARPFKSGREVEGQSLVIYVTNICIKNSSFRFENWHWCISTSCTAPKVTVCLSLMGIIGCSSQHLLKIFGKQLECFQFIQTEFSALLNSWNTHMHHLCLLSFCSAFIEFRGEWVSQSHTKTHKNLFWISRPPPHHPAMLISFLCAARHHLSWWCFIHPEW